MCCILGVEFEKDDLDEVLRQQIATKQLNKLLNNTSYYLMAH